MFFSIKNDRFIYYERSSIDTVLTWFFYENKRKKEEDGDLVSQ
jgi:hypothetical protein